MGNIVNAKSKVPQLRFPEFSGSWASYKLGALSVIRSASRVHKEQWTESGVPFFRTSDVVAAHKGRDNRKIFISNDLYEELSKKSGKVKANDLLVTGGGSIGVPYLIPNDEPLYFKDADLLWFSNKNSLNGLYLYEFLLSPKFRRHLERISHKGTISHFTIEQAKKTPIILPKLSEQQKIADLLSSVNKRISLLEQKHEQLIQYKKGIMQQLFSQQLRFKDDDGQDFPDWEVTTISSFMIESRVKGSTGDIAKKITVKLWGKGVFEKTRKDDGSVNTQYYIRKSGQFLYSKLDFLNCAFGIVPEELDGFESTVDLPCFDMSDEINKTFILEYIKQKRFYKKYGDMADGSRKAKRIHADTFLSFPINLPSEDEQNKIADFLESIDQKINLAQQQIEQIHAYKQGLLQQMFV
jgi:type I restriction enzyme S subunit